MGGHAARGYWEHLGLAMLMGGVLLAPFAWVVDLQVSYAMVKWACANGARSWMLLVPVVSLSLVGAATWMAWKGWRRLHGDADLDGGRMEDRSYFLALTGLGFSAIIALLILVSLLPRVLLSPCE